MKPIIPSFWHSKTHLQVTWLGCHNILSETESREILLFDIGKPGLLRYYFCWLSLCHSAAWWLSTRQCIISPMRAIIIRTVWMALYDVEMQSWCEGQLNRDFLKMNEYIEMFLEKWTSLDIYKLLKEVHWSHQRDKLCAVMLRIVQHRPHPGELRAEYQGHAKGKKGNLRFWE